MPVLAGDFEGQFFRWYEFKVIFAKRPAVRAAPSQVQAPSGQAGQVLELEDFSLTCAGRGVALDGLFKRFGFPGSAYQFEGSPAREEQAEALEPEFECG